MAFVIAPFALLLLVDVSTTGGLALGTRAGEFPDASQYQFLAQQPSQAGLEALLSSSQLPAFDQQQANLGSLLGTSAQFSPQQAGLQSLLSETSQLPALNQQQANLASFLGSSAQVSSQPSQQFLQAQLPQQAQPLQQLPADMDTSAGLGFFQTQQASSFPQVSQGQNMMANVQMKEVADLMHSVETLQKELSSSRMHEKQLNTMAYNAAQRSESIDQSARKLASLAQASVSEVASMKAHVKEVEKEKSELSTEKDELQTQLSEARSTVKRIQDREAAENTQVLEVNAAYKRRELALAQQDDQRQQLQQKRQQEQQQQEDQRQQQLRTLRSLRSQASEQRQQELQLQQQMQQLQLQQQASEANQDYNPDQLAIAKASPDAQAKALAQAQALAQSSPESFAQLYNTARLSSAPSSSSYQSNVQERLPNSLQAGIPSENNMLERLRADSYADFTGNGRAPPSSTYGAYNSRAASEAVDRQPSMNFLENRR